MEFLRVTRMTWHRERRAWTEKVMRLRKSLVNSYEEFVMDPEMNRAAHFKKPSKVIIAQGPLEMSEERREGKPPRNENTTMIIVAVTPEQLDSIFSPEGV